MKLKAVVVLLFCIASGGFVSQAQAQWYQVGSGTGPAVNGTNFNYNQASVLPDCGFGQQYVCDPDWSWHAHNLAFNGTPVLGASMVQNCMQVRDGQNYEVDACAESDYARYGFKGAAWFNYIKVYYVNHSTNAVTTLVTVTLGTCVNCSQPSNYDYWIRFSEVYSSGQDKYTLTISPDGVNWSNWGVWYYGRSGQPAVAFTMAAGTDNSGSNYASASIDSWVTHETAGNVTPNLLDTDIGPGGVPVPGRFCDQDECASNGQILYSNL